MEGALENRGTFRGIARTLLVLALLAERAAGRSLPVRFLVLAILYRAEAVARAFVAGTTGADCLDEPSVMRYGAADAEILALRLRMIAAVLGVLADADGDAGDQTQPEVTAERPVLLLVMRFPGVRGSLRPHDTS
ncbi:MAG: hypothetical protein F9K19_07275 [Rhizobiaceae bacterium]|uniref:hypothetical protein n=1 Tax=Albidovulum sp. TaxID=1872424 RepID=UPI0013AE7F55|nr:MAG: hypothetical protein F9K19_07275 [Rhizobiaceae bacterium]CAG1012688.1 hypothetical protein RHIZO_04312 [Rhizobiaceae bacterium]